VINPLIVDVDPNNGIATVPEVLYGNYTCCGYEASAIGSGFVFSCTGTIDITFDMFNSGGDFGNYRLVLEKQ
jgi:hypothetical protein